MCHNEGKCRRFPPHSKIGKIRCDIRSRNIKAPFEKFRDELSDADVIMYSQVFESEKLANNPDMLEQLNNMRKVNQYGAAQIWAFFQWESPGLHRENLKPYDKFFNATVTYRKDSTFWHPYSSLSWIRLNGYYNERYRKDIYGIDTLPGNIDELTEDQLDEYVRNQPLDNKFGVMSRVRRVFFYFKPEWCAGFWGSPRRFKGSNVL